MVSEATSLYRWHSPPRSRSSFMESWPLVIGHTGSFEHITLSVPCWWMGRVLLHLLVQFRYTAHEGNAYRQSHCNVLPTWSSDVRHWENAIHFCAALSKRNRFLYDFWSWVQGGHPMPAEGTAGWQADGWMVSWLLDVHLPWAPHWVPIFCCRLYHSLWGETTHALHCQLDVK